MPYWVACVGSSPSANTETYDDAGLRASARHSVLHRLLIRLVYAAQGRLPAAAATEDHSTNISAAADGAPEDGQQFGRRLPAL